MDDGKIIDMFLQRDERAIEHTKEKYGKRLLSLSLRITGERMTAEECENDTYKYAWESIPPKEPREYFYPYLSRVIRSISLNRARNDSRQKRGGTVSELSSELEACIPSYNGENMLNELAFAEILNKFLCTLDKNKKKIFLLRYFYMYSVGQIADMSGFSKSKIKSILFRTRNELKIYLEKENYTI